MLAKTTRIIKKIAIFGDAQAKNTEEHFLLAYQVSRLLALEGYVIVNGGGPGVMLAATLGGAGVEGSIEEAVVIDNKIEMGKNYEGQFEQNMDKIDVVITEENYPERLQRLISEADAFVVLRGGTGTISEFGEVWVQAKFDFGKHKPIVLLGKLAFII